MALLIEKNVTVLGDIDVSSLYVRLTSFYGPGGSPIRVKSQTYSSKESWVNNPLRNYFYVPGIPEELQISYDRALDGSDLLTHVHNKFKSQLSSDIEGQRYVLDPSTGEALLDPSTGDPIYESYVISPKFAMDSSISLIDIE
jgi:hypothetical protein